MAAIDFFFLIISVAYVNKNVGRSGTLVQNCLKHDNEIGNPLTWHVALMIDENFGFQAVKSLNSTSDCIKDGQRGSTRGAVQSSMFS